jgi:hypothetical protein
MIRLLALAFVLAALLPLSGCYPYPYPYYTAVPVNSPSTFDRSWDAALGAAEDAGVQVNSADRANGLITGNKAGAAVTIKLQSQADGRLGVSFEAPSAKESNPTLKDRWLAAYQRRMGR